MRHGKSDWNAEFQQDAERPLAQRGIRAAQTMGEVLAKAEQWPDLILSSTAVRTRQTTAYFAETGQLNCDIQWTDAFYESCPERVLSVIQSIPLPVKTLMIVGHEPTSSRLVSALIGGGTVAFPTAAIARIDFELLNWSEVAFGSGILRWFLQPKLFT